MDAITGFKGRRCSFQAFTQSKADPGAQGFSVNVSTCAPLYLHREDPNQKCALTVFCLTASGSAQTYPEMFEVLNAAAVVT